MEPKERTALGVAFGLGGLIIACLAWWFPQVELAWKIGITAIAVAVLLSSFWRRFRAVFEKHWQETLCFLLLAVVIWIFSARFPAFLLPGILIILVSVAIATLVLTKYILWEHGKRDKTLIFDEDFHDPKNWSLNHWGSNCCSISGNQMRFTGPSGPKGEEGSHIDLVNKLEVGRRYEVACRVKAEAETTAQFRLWCHDKIRPDVVKGTNVETGFKTPPPHGEFVFLIYRANHNPDIRVHLQYKPGKGTIYVDNVRIYRIP